ncbi:myo-inosose-2 dehydratase [Pontibacillus sp. HMF3514]|uniref:myo-inosose-2 dehydratase n=1 Tax=Pontibacillus sp. HMF3514 TaxID=2692425 RepID=UPI00131F5B1F|nr:myo-inosose-2 dehydratase [Pontibacillus sp. HMF3514]QHE51704.1 myo-inosose-2 dehydratase [Pontibacillus sp. HMF3514]
MFKENTIKLGIAPIGWTNDDLPELGGDIPFEQCVSEMALAGFEGTEVGNKYPHNRDELNNALTLRNLKVASAWFSAFTTTEPLENTIEEFIKHRDFLHDMGAKVIVVSEQGHSIQHKDVSLFDEKPIFTEEEWDLLAEGMNKLGALAKEKGMEVVFHHHMGTGVQTTQEVDRLMEMTDPNLVHLLYDTGHLYFSGEDPLIVLKQHLHRIKHVHLKDVRQSVARSIQENNKSFLEAVKEGVFTVPGDGVIDFEPIFSILAEAEYHGWFVVEAEQDPELANPLQYALSAREYIYKTAGL